MNRVEKPQTMIVKASDIGYCKDVVIVRSITISNSVFSHNNKEIIVPEFSYATSLNIASYLKFITSSTCAACGQLIPYDL